MSPIPTSTGPIKPTNQIRTEAETCASGLVTAVYRAGIELSEDQEEFLHVLFCSAYLKGAATGSDDTVRAYQKRTLSPMQLLLLATGLTLIAYAFWGVR